MEDFIEPAKKHGGLRGRPAPDVGIGIRVRGKTKKLTGYVAIKGSVLRRVLTEEQIEDGGYCKLLIGQGVNHQHILRILPAHQKGSVSAELPKANARLRKQQGDSYLLETAMIPLPEGAAITRRQSAKFLVEEGQHLTVFFFPYYATEGLPEAKKIELVPSGPVEKLPESGTESDKEAAVKRIAREQLPWEGEPDEL